MASLTGKKIKDTYPSLLKTEDNGAIGSTKKKMTDGLGTPSSLELSTVDAKINGDLQVTGTVSASSYVGVENPNDATITVTAGAGVDGGGSFTTDQATNAEITISHSDTSSQANITSSVNTFVDGVTLDDYGHVTGLTTQEVSIPDPVVAGDNINIATNNVVNLDTDITVNSVTSTTSSTSDLEVNSMAIAQAITIASVNVVGGSESLYPQYLTSGFLIPDAGYEGIDVFGFASGYSSATQVISVGDDIVLDGITWGTVTSVTDWRINVSVSNPSAWYSYDFADYVSVEKSAEATQYVYSDAGVGFETFDSLVYSASNEIVVNGTASGVYASAIEPQTGAFICADLTLSQGDVLGYIKKGWVKEGSELVAELDSNTLSLATSKGLDVNGIKLDSSKDGYVKHSASIETNVEEVFKNIDFWSNIVDCTTPNYFIFNVNKSATPSTVTISTTLITSSTDQRAINLENNLNLGNIFDLQYPPTPGGSILKFKYSSFFTQYIPGAGYEISFTLDDTYSDTLPADGNYDCSSNIASGSDYLIWETSTSLVVDYENSPSLLAGGYMQNQRTGIVYDYSNLSYANIGIADKVVISGVPSSEFVDGDVFDFYQNNGSITSTSNKAYLEKKLAITSWNSFDKGEQGIDFDQSRVNLYSKNVKKAEFDILAISFYDAVGSNIIAKFDNNGTYLPPVYSAQTGSSANVYISSNGRLYRSISSEKYKHEIESYTKGLEELKQLEPKSFVYKNDESGTVHAGFIAEDIDSVGLKEYVQYEELDGIESIEGVQYDKLTALLVNAVKELSAKVDDLQAEIQTLKNS